MAIRSRIRSALAAVRGAFAPAQVAQPDYAAEARRRAAVDYVEPEVRTYNRWTPADIKAAQQLADGGNLRRAADLCEAILADDRANAVLNTRVNALLGSDIGFEAGRGRKKKAAVKALEAGEDWYSAFDEAVLGQTLLWGRLLGVQPTQAHWREFADHGGRVIPVVETYHARYLRRDQRARAWFVTTGDTQHEVRIEAGDGKWGLFTPYGANRPWVHGLWRGMARWWLLKQYAIDDWGRHSELHGNGIKVGIPPEVGNAQHGNPKLRRELADDLANLASDGVIVLPPGFDFKLVEATANTWEMFKAQIDAANTAMSVMAIGTNLPTEVGNAAATGATAQNLVRLDYKKSDAEALSTFCHDQHLVWWAEFNFAARGLAPWPAWDVEPPADLQARATLIGSVMTAIKTGGEANVPLDVPAILEEFEIPAREVPPDEATQQGQVYKYHLDYGILSKNEIRRRIGEKPVPGGEAIPVPLVQPGGGGQAEASATPDASTMAALSAKAARHAAAHPGAAVPVETLSTVWTRGAAGHGDEGPLWGMGRVNAFLVRAAGGADYGEDHDLMEAR